ncbi:MAG TPA: hybrid sensor histidine kinase/response regulator [Verrucomicrobiales bacterium]|nr:hybrid sensor histidine kinase/response regulator [Verrucomicrobiales bacterium]
MKKILVIEDTPAMRELIVDTLTTHHYDCVAADDGLAGVDAARRYHPDLVICDIHMPRMDGYGVLEAIRTEATMSTMPFIFLTGATERTDIRRGMELGADDYLTKPFTIQELMASVTAQFEKQATIQRQSDRRLEELRGNITMALPHELRTPLNGILGLSSMLLEDGETMSREEVRENLQFIHQSANRLHRLIENFLVYSQIELMHADPSCTDKLPLGDSVSADGLIAGWAEEVAAGWSRSGDLRLNLLPCTCSVPADNLKKIVTELVDNAFKFSAAEQPVSVEAFNEGERLHLRIHDTGRGFSPDQIARVGAHMQFDRKYYEQQGAGLGLIISKRLSELHGGRFSVQSEPLVMTSINVVLPA